MKFSLYKKTNNLPHLNEALATFIVTYCLAEMTNSNLNFNDWHVGITSDDNLNPTKYKFGKCTSHLEALQTKTYLVNEKQMVDDNEEISGDETIIYVYRN